MYTAAKEVPLSALQHYAFCPRQCALIHIEQQWDDNSFTAEGILLHQRVDSLASETRKGVRYERGVSVFSRKLGLVGKLDLLEVEKDKYTPVEYKRGKSKVQDWDRIQLCAQAICLEEMLGVSIQEGELWYWEVRKREWVEIDEVLRQVTLRTIEECSEMFVNSLTPKAIFAAKCRSCSLIEVCRPKVSMTDRSQDYIKSLLASGDEQ